jgi:hypothetical protein
VTILFENLDSQLLVDQVILGEQDIKRDIVRRGDRADGVGLESGDEGGSEVLSGYRRGDLRAETVVEAPLEVEAREGRSEEDDGDVTEMLKFTQALDLKLPVSPNQH